MKLIIATGARTPPIIEISLPHNPPPLKTHENRSVSVLIKSQHFRGACLSLLLNDLFWALGADFREGNEDSNFSLFRVRRFTEWPGPLH